MGLFAKMNDGNVIDSMQNSMHWIIKEDWDGMPFVIDIFVARKFWYESLHSYMAW